MLNPPPLALYVHVPWCLRKCPYCDFNSHEQRGVLPEARYVDALLADAEQSLPDVWGRPVESVFIGGGTPSLFSPDSIDRLLGGLRALLNFRPDLEVTLEANPGTFEVERFKGFRAAGINRLSLGVQSFDDRYLARLGRVHDARQASVAAQAAVALFPATNLDVMYALPQQTVADALADIARAVELGPGHVSAYHLTLEPNTAFHRNPPPVPDDDTAFDMQDAIEHELAIAGYRRYEISAFARPGMRCRHNVNYWEFGDYLGIGAGAHGKLSTLNGIRRETRARNPSAYMEAALGGRARDTATMVPQSELAFEFMLNALRLIDGIPIAYFARRTGLPTSHVQERLYRARERGLLAGDAQRLRASEHGLRFLNDLLEMFLDPDDATGEHPADS